jgi:hypothetical protein
MDNTSKHFAYRCTPMVIANASGWEILCPFNIDAEWNGGRDVGAVTVTVDRPDNQVRSVVCSHFGHGILTFHPGYVFQTPPRWAVWARGTPNRYKDGITPLEGLVETDWLPFSFTMNWRFTRPGKIHFQAGEPFCYLTLAPHGVLDSIEPELMKLEDDPDAKAGHEDWLMSRRSFNAALKEPDSDERRQGWQKRYLRAIGAPDEAFHITKRKLQPFIEKPPGSIADNAEPDD